MNVILMERQRLKNLAVKAQTTTTAQILQPPLGTIRMTAIPAKTMSRSILCPFVLVSALSLLASCAPNTAVSHGRNTALDSVDLIEMTQKMTDAILADPNVQSGLAQKGRLKVVIQPVENKMVGEILPCGEKEAFIARLRTNLQERAPEKFTWIINRDSWHALRAREIDRGPDPEGIQPEYALTATFSSITDESSKRRSSYYLCVYHLTDLQSRQVIWTDKFEVKKSAVKEFLD